MSEIVIKVENLSKQYRIGAREGYRTFRETLVDAVKAPLQGLFRAFNRRSAVGGRSSGNDTIWALKDVSFEVKQGEVVGIIGRNGAGKSTLLKILSRITEPTEGRVELRGRVGSLLEVGTGFHPELTGHENIYLYGAILGMDRWEITRKFDEIVAFAEIEKFIDTPVKKYSSGMYMRLAFAVAAHLEPEILLVDEVLAVGDTTFQKKCLGKMGEVSSEGRTVLFVSHNMAAVQQLCARGMVLAEGKVGFWGDIRSAINHYVQDMKILQTVSLADRRDRRGSQWLKFTKVGLFDPAGNERNQVVSGQHLYVRFYYQSEKAMRKATVNVAFNIRSSQGYLLTNLNSIDVDKSIMDLHPNGFFQCSWPRFNLRSGSYDCALFCAVNGDIVDWLQSAFAINVEDGDFFNTGRVISREQGDLLVSYDWTSHPMEK
jgi:lipopolysaccharide transport system ATP-binding protein